MRNYQGGWAMGRAGKVVGPPPLRKDAILASSPLRSAPQIHPYASVSPPSLPLPPPTPPLYLPPIYSQPPFPFVHTLPLPLSRPPSSPSPPSFALFPSIPPPHPPLSLLRQATERAGGLLRRGARGGDGMDRAGRAWGVVASWDLGLGARAGVFKYANGDVYDGDWKDDKKHGKGALGARGGGGNGGQVGRRVGVAGT